MFCPFKAERTIVANINRPNGPVFFVGIFLLQGFFDNVVSSMYNDIVFGF